ncbi:hypothetical protein GCM10010400_27030 [Streptomyces aculeolatus]
MGKSQCTASKWRSEVASECGGGNIADDRRLAKPAFLQTIEGSRTPPDVVWRGYMVSADNAAGCVPDRVALFVPRGVA